MKKETIKTFEENGVLNIEKIINGYNAYIYKILKNSISSEADIEEILYRARKSIKRNLKERGYNYGE